MGHKSKRIVVCCDGTGQKLDVARSNVVRLFGALDRSDPEEQIAYYDPGVGTMPAAAALTSVSRRLTVWAGLIGGFGVLERVTKAYSFIVDRYAQGDQIYFIGFSRGALTVRLVAALLHRFGVLRPDARNLIPYGLELCSKHYTQIHDAGERCQARAIDNEFRNLFSVEGPVHIRFLGVWDTVKALGVLKPISFPHVRHNPSIQTVRHAIALDESRRSYMFTSWGGLRGFVEAGPPPGQDVMEVWFSGVHSDIGGGYPQEESGLSLRSFRWMAGEASGARLKFDDGRLADVLCALDRASTGENSRFFMRHESKTLGWRLLDLVPRRELANAPARQSHSSEKLEDELPLPLGWPIKKFSWRPAGHRDAEVYRRDGPLLLHWSVKQLVEEGRYALKDVRYVEDAPLPPPGHDCADL